MKSKIIIVATLLQMAWSSQAAIDGFAKSFTSSGSQCQYVVPSGKILVFQQVSYPTTSTLSDRAMTIIPSGGFGAVVAFPGASNGLYVLPKAMLLPAGTTITGCAASGGVGMFGVLIDTSDAPLFVGGGSSLGNVVLANNTMTAELQLPSTAGSRVLFQSSTDLVNWSYDTSVVARRSEDKTKVRFTVPVASNGRFYRALVRRSNAG